MSATLQPVRNTFTIVRYGLIKEWPEQKPHVGLIVDEPGGVIGDLSGLADGRVDNIEDLLNSRDLSGELKRLSQRKIPHHNIRDTKLLACIGEKQPVWAAGVTFFNSVLGREDESGGSNRYRRVYNSPRPELFVKAFQGEVIGPGEDIHIRSDSDWNAAEAELLIVFNPRGGIVGYACADDMSSRSIEGDNELNLPQAKIYYRSCGIGDKLVIGHTVKEAREWKVRLEIKRSGETVFGKESTVSNMKRTFEELRDYLFKWNRFPNGVALSTGTDIVPTKDECNLQDGDLVIIGISGIGEFTNTVKVLQPRTDLEPIV